MMKVPSPPKPGWKFTKAQDIEPGTCFVKRTAGENGFAYLRIGQDSLTVMGVKPGYVHGVCYNGNMTSVPFDTLVWSVPLEQMAYNRGQERAWEDTVGVTESSPYLNRGEEEMPLQPHEVLRDFGSEDRVVIKDSYDHHNKPWSYEIAKRSPSIYVMFRKNWSVIHSPSGNELRRIYRENPSDFISEPLYLAIPSYLKRLMDEAMDDL